MSIIFSRPFSFDHGETDILLKYLGGGAMSKLIECVLGSVVKTYSSTMNVDGTTTPFSLYP